MLADDRCAALAELATLTAAGVAEAVWWTWSLAGTSAPLDAVAQARLEAGMLDGTAERAGQWLSADADALEAGEPAALQLQFLARLHALAARRPGHDRRSRRHVGGPTS